MNNGNAHRMKPWKLHFDGSCSKQHGSGAGVILESPEGVKETYHEDLGKGLTYNQSEYAALIIGLGIARDRKVQHVKILDDSKLICNQVSGNWEVRFENLIPYHQITKELAQGFKTLKIKHIPREQNWEVDAATRNCSRE